MSIIKKRVIFFITLISPTHTHTFHPSHTYVLTSPTHKTLTHIHMIFLMMYTDHSTLAQ